VVVNANDFTPEQWEAIVNEPVLAVTAIDKWP